MTEIEVLTECLKKVKQSGWDAYKSTYSRVYERENGHLMVEFFTDVEKPPIIVSYEEVFLSYSFAEHFWGMDTMYFVVYSDNAPGMQGDVIGWKSEKEMEALQALHSDLPYYDDIAACEFHLQQIVLEADQTKRIAYLEKFLKTEKQTE